MRFKINRKDLSAALAVAMSCWKSRPNHAPICVIYDLNEKSIVIESTAAEFAVSIRLDATVERNGSVVVELDKLIPVVSGLSDVSIEIATEGEKEDRLAIVNKAGKIRIPTEDRPNLAANFGKAVNCSMSGRVLVESLKRVIRCVDSNDGRWALHSACIDLTDESSLWFVATDGVRMTAQKVSATIDMARDRVALLPPNAAAMAIRLFDGAEKVSISIDENAITFSADGLSLWSRLFEGRYPRWQEVAFPKKTSIIGTVDADDLAHAMRLMRILILEEQRSVKWSLGRPGIVFSTSNNIRGGRHECKSIEWQADDEGPINIWLDPSLVLEGVRTLPAGTKVGMSMMKNTGKDGKEKQTSVYFDSPENGWRFTVMSFAEPAMESVVEKDEPAEMVGAAK